MVSVLMLVAALPGKAAPKCEAQFDKLHKSYTLNPDGSQELRVRKQLTLFTHTAMNETYGESFIVYDPTYQELVIHESYTVQNDGTVIQTPANAFVEVLPSSAANAVAYNYLKEMVVVHTGLELGATIFLDYSVITKAGALPALDIFEPVEELSPIKEYVLSISVPSGTPLHYQLLNGKTEPSVTDADGVMNVTWTLKNVNPSPRSLAVSVESGNLQAVTATTFATRDEVLNVLRTQVYSPDDEAVKAVLRKLESERDRSSIVNKIARYVNDMALSPLTLAETGYRVRPAAEVIGSAYATAAEKAFLGDALMQATGMSHDIWLTFPVTEDPAAAGLASLKSIACNPISEDKTHMAMMTLPGYVAVCTLAGEPVKTEAGYELDVTDALEIASDKGVDLGNGYRAYYLNAKSSRWLSEVYAKTTSNTTRPVNLLLPSLPHERLECVLDVEEGMAPVALPEPLDLENGIGSVKVSVLDEGGKLTIVRELQIVKQLIAPEEYPMYYALMEAWYAAAKTPIVFSKQ